jgi:hypothetical protein
MLSKEGDGMVPQLVILREVEDGAAAHRSRGCR